MTSPAKSDSSIGDFHASSQEPADPNSLLDQVAMDYLQGAADARVALRKTLKDSGAALHLSEYAQNMCERIRQKKDPQLVRMGLAAISLVDSAWDPRDALYALGHLYRAAQRIGITDPMPVFREVGALATDRSPHSTAALMLAFDQTQVCRELADIPATDLPALVRKGDVIGLRDRLQAGDDPNALGPKRVTPLMLAARNGCRPVIQLLLKSGAQVDLVDEAGWSPLVYAAVEGHWGAVELLLAAGAPGHVQPDGLPLEALIRKRAPAHLTKKGLQILASLKSKP